MSQSPAVAWDPAPADTSNQSAADPAPPVGPDWDSMNIVAGVPRPPDAATVEVKTESFADKWESVAREQIAAVKMSHDQTRLNKAVGERVAALVTELGLPPPRTEEENIDTMAQSKVEEFEVQRLNFLAEKKAREIFFEKHPEMRTQEKKQTVMESTQAMSEALMAAFLRFIRDEHQRDERREHREAARKKA